MARIVRQYEVLRIREKRMWNFLGILITYNMREASIIKARNQGTRSSKCRKPQYLLREAAGTIGIAVVESGIEASAKINEINKTCHHQNSPKWENSNILAGGTIS